MNNKKLIAIGISVGLVVAAYVFVQGRIEKLLGVQLELWPALIAPAMISLFGDGTEGKKKFYGTTAAGIIIAMVFIMAEHALKPTLGLMGILGALVIITALIVILGKPLPYCFGKVTFIAFNFALLVKGNIYALTLARLGVLFIGSTIFLFVEHKVIGLIMPPSESKKEKS
ncbi:DUF1097 family protein [Enterocloster lavalensis]|uniref:DUF1097 family protein n=1 Tax=Enterocloster lavalensis TaxID=460384 RepID=UPI0026656D23|nr:DUF1097 family protein [Enterocloster lavalensis]